jgi:hypothetical protein
MKKRMLARNQQQGIVEGSVIATTSIAQADQKAHRPSSASTIFATIPPQHIVLREERKKKKQMQQSQGLDNQAQGVQITKSANTSSNDNIETVQVGAFPSTAGRGPTAANAHVDDEATPSLPPVGPIIEAMPFEESGQTETQVLKALLKSRKCRIMLALTVLLIRWSDCCSCAGHPKQFQGIAN